MAGSAFLNVKDLVLFKLETTYGLDSSPSEANSGNAIKLTEPPKIDVTQEFLEQNGGDGTRGFTTPIGTVRPTGVTFRSYVTGFSNSSPASYTASVKPPLADVFRACGMFETFITSNAAGNPEYQYNPSAAVDSDASATIVVNIDGIDTRMVGARGNCNLILSAAAPIIAEFTFRGQLTTEAQTIRGQATVHQVIPPRWIDSGSIIVDSYRALMENFNLNTNNTILEERASQAASGSGIARILITDRAPGGSLDPDISNTTSFDVLGKWRSSSLATVQINVGLNQGNRVTINVSASVYKRLGWGDKSGLAIFNLDYQAYKQGTGNNEWRVSFN
jgi:hypothetical protein